MYRYIPIHLRTGAVIWKGVMRGYRWSFKAFCLALVQQTWKHYILPSSDSGEFDIHDSLHSVCVMVCPLSDLWRLGLESVWAGVSPFTFTNYTEVTENTPQSFWTGLTVLSLTWLLCMQALAAKQNCFWKKNCHTILESTAGVGVHCY